MRSNGGQKLGTHCVGYASEIKSLSRPAYTCCDRESKMEIPVYSL